ncbi:MULTISPECIES: PilN domain-containing protein [Silvimonas]|uniref:PilN domain-containing protein n=1 Tax=Silvimonas TaxID=300264 RepID=UPI0024B33705|nr:MULTISPECIES: PilN domain-containing protein [Silvimonas]MDR3425838.1 PilN domain-containing protein [Silvimonas sp.]
MIRINLLPHREQARKARHNRYLAALGFTFVASAAVVALGYFFYQARLDTQNERNTFLTQENAKLDQQIAEIEKLKLEKQQLLDRKKVVERLQSNRSEDVKVLDQLTRQTPEGIYLKSVKQKDALLVLNGYAQSNARVSTLMRNLSDSPVFEQPTLVEVKSAQVANQRLSEFTLNVAITRVTDDASAPAAAARRPASAAGGTK